MGNSGRFPQGKPAATESRNATLIGDYTLAWSRARAASDPLSYRSPHYDGMRRQSDVFVTVVVTLQNYINDNLSI